MEEKFLRFGNKYGINSRKIQYRKNLSILTKNTISGDKYVLRGTTYMAITRGKNAY